MGHANPNKPCNPSQQYISPEMIMTCNATGASALHELFDSNASALQVLSGSNASFVHPFSATNLDDFTVDVVRSKCLDERKW